MLGSGDIALLVLNFVEVEWLGFCSCLLPSFGQPLVTTVTQPHYLLVFLSFLNNLYSATELFLKVFIM
jgi:hypothetical protein